MNPNDDQTIINDIEMKRSGINEGGYHQTRSRTLSNPRFGSIDSQSQYGYHSPHPSTGSIYCKAIHQVLLHILVIYAAGAVTYDIFFSQSNTDCICSTPTISSNLDAITDAPSLSSIPSSTTLQPSIVFSPTPQPTLSPSNYPSISNANIDTTLSGASNIETSLFEIETRITEAENYILLINQTMLKDIETLSTLIRTMNGSVQASNHEIGSVQTSLFEMEERIAKVQDDIMVVNETQIEDIRTLETRTTEVENEISIAKESYIAEIGDLSNDISDLATSVAVSINALNNTIIEKINRISSNSPTASPVTNSPSDQPTLPPTHDFSPYETFIGDFKISAQNQSHGNWLLCDGSFLDPNIYTQLFNVIGYSFGHQIVGTVKEFALPDATDRVVGINGDSNAMGHWTGNEQIALTQSHLPAHTHKLVNSVEANGRHDAASRPTLATAANIATGTLTNENFEYQLRANSGTANIFTSGSTGSGNSFNIMQPTVFVGNLFIYF